MPDAQPQFIEVDRLIHEPARLAILTVLSSCQSADFLFLHHATGLSKGNLSVQLSRLEEAGLVRIEKAVKKKKMHTTLSLTKHGAVAVERYWKTMDEIKKRAIPKRAIELSASEA